MSKHKPTLQSLAAQYFVTELASSFESGDFPIPNNAPSLRNRSPASSAMNRETKVLVAILILLVAIVASLWHWLHGGITTQDRTPHTADPVKVPELEAVSKVRVSGDVVRPGIHEFITSSPKTLTEILQAAGWNQSSDLQRVKVFRGKQVQDYNVQEIRLGNPSRSNFRLKDGDQVIVPTTRTVF